MIVTSEQPQPFEVEFQAVPASVAAARHAVRAYLAGVDTSDPPLGDVTLAVSEAVTNVVNHAYLDASPGEVRVAVELFADEIEVVVEDFGRGMQPRPDSPGLGLGLPLMARVAERFDTRSVLGQGTRLCLWFRRHPGAATLPA